MDEEQTREPMRARGFWEYFRAGFVDAHRRRPFSFYLLLLVPVALALGAHIIKYRDAPGRFALMLTLLFVFFWIVTARALNDFFHLLRTHRAERRAVYLETIGDPEFASTLGERVRRRARKS